jgi:hypothetical protein
MTQLQGNIVGGPGKFDLMLAIFEGKEVGFTFEFKDARKSEAVRFLVRLDSIGREDRFSQSLNLTGQVIKSNRYAPRARGAGHEGLAPYMPPFEAYYDIQTRLGTYKILESRVKVVG